MVRYEGRGGGVDIVLCNNMKVNSSGQSDSNADSCGNLVLWVFETVYFILLVSGVHRTHRVPQCDGKIGLHDILILDHKSKYTECRPFLIPMPQPTHSPNERFP